MNDLIRILLAALDEMDLPEEVDRQLQLEIAQQLAEAVIAAGWPRQDS